MHTRWRDLPLWHAFCGQHKLTCPDCMRMSLQISDARSAAREAEIKLVAAEARANKVRSSSRGDFSHIPDPLIVCRAHSHTQACLKLAHCTCLCWHTACFVPVVYCWPQFVDQAALLVSSCRLRSRSRTWPQLRQRCGRSWRTDTPPVAVAYPVSTQ